MSETEGLATLPVPEENGHVVATLKEWRLRRLLKQKELAERAQVSLSTVNAIERGHRPRIEIETMRRLAAVLRVRPAQVDEFAAVIGVEPEE
jgi:transcriptional regulator with XRE-family HTH domain